MVEWDFTLFRCLRLAFEIIIDVESIARRIIEAHGGQITVGAGAPIGAEIVVILPSKNP